jgi:branched-chain amino acid transport system substrate-binding protein
VGGPRRPGHPLAPDGKGALALSIFEEHPPFTDNPVAAEFVKAFRERATKANLPYPKVDTQAAGKVRFDGPYNYGDDFSKVKQVQDGQWFVVWPTQYAAPGRRLLAP